MYFASKNKILVFMCFLHIRRTCASDFFIAKQYGIIDKYVCVTNSSYPMSWIQEEITTRLSYEPSFIPSTNESNFNSGISLRDPSTKPFNRSPWFHVPSSLNFDFNSIILDRRWQELKTYMTEFNGAKGTLLNYTIVLENLRNDFEIPFSIRLKQEGHIFLCDGDSPPNSNCYWLLLQAWSGTKTAIRKCNSGYIPSQQEKWAEAPCSDILKEQDHTNKPDSRYFSNKKWSHLKITKKGNVLSLFSVNNKREERNIITLEDPEPLVGITHMIIHSKQFNGFWKIHNMEFIYTTEESTKIRLGNPINPQKNYLCINLFIAMCSFCTMTLTLQDSRNETIEEKVYKFSSPGWSEIKFTTEKIKQNNNPVKFLVSTSSSSNDRFWAIDDIRLCQRTEFRVITLTEDAKCQLMSEEDDVISLSTNVQRLDSSCSENTIGDFCVPCTWVFDSCEQIEVCQEDKCVCSAGYQEYRGYRGNYQCYDECDWPYYGHGCLKSCPNCPNSECNHIDGTCKYTGPCLGGYTGPKCDIRPTLIFKKPPETTKADYSEAIVIVRDFSIEKGVHEKPQTYFFEYKKADQKNIFEWIKYGPEITFNESKNVTIRNLEAGTKYFVRAVVVSDNKKSYENAYVKYSSFETLCDELSKANITTQPSNSGVVISIRNSRKLCSFAPHGRQTKSDSSLTNHVRLFISRENNSLENFEKSGLVFNCSFDKSRDSFDLIIGDNKQPADCEKIKNPPLQEGTEYKVIIFFVDNFDSKNTTKTVSLTFTTTSENDFNNNYLFSLLGLFLVVPFFYYIKYKKHQQVYAKFVSLYSLDTLQRRLINTAKNKPDLQTQKQNYQNTILHSSQVEIGEFYNYVKTAESCGQLKRQHEIIIGTMKTYETIFSNFQVEYVDMNYASGQQLRKVYIATQLPQKSQMNRFWNIVWEENVRHIVLFDNIPSNKHKYWPDQNENMRLENIFIECNASKKYEFYTCRTFTVSSNGQKRQIKQQHFSSNTSEYLSTIKYVNFFKEISNIPLGANSPILIHSSSGMSGNCFVLLCDISLRAATKDGVVDVMNTLRKLTKFSAQLVVDYDHYLLAHRTVLEGLLYTKTSIDCASLDSDYPFYIGHHETRKRLKYLQETWWLDCHFGCSRPTINDLSNDNFNDQISKKISIHGFENPRKFFVIPHPLMDTTNRFWKQIEKENISVIISPNGNASAWPHKNVSSMQLSCGITLKKTNSKQFSTYEWITVEMNARNIEIFSMKNWSDKLIQPHNVSDFVNFFVETNVILNQHQFIAVTCHDDGLTPAGLYFTMSYNIQKLKEEGVSDICSCIRLIRSQCRHIFSDEMSYKFLMKATGRYINEIRLYEAK